MKATIQAAALILFAASAAHAQQAVQWRAEDGGNGHWYQWHQRVLGRDWDGWVAFSNSMGGHLAEITSEQENAFVAGPAVFQGAFPAVNGAHARIGAFQAPDSGEPAEGWTWVTGTAVVVTPGRWGSLEDCCGGSYCNGDGEDSAAVWSWAGDAEVSGLAGRWNDVGKCLDWWGAIVEWSADCNSDGIVDYGQILEGHLADANSNNVPDRCECGAFPTLPSCCLGDLNADRSIDGADLGALLFAWGPAVPQSPADLDGDGQVGGADLGLLLFGWGACPVATPPWATLLEASPDPAVVTDPSLRAAIAATGLAWRVRDIGTGIEMLLVPPGTFQMGCSPSWQFACSESEFPTRTVTISRPFYLGRYEVTQREWRNFTGGNPSFFQGFPNSDSRPVEQVSWGDASTFAAATGMRLPTEAEWEYACRGGTATAFFNGSDDDSTLGTIAWIGSNDGDQVQPVGQKLANPLGLHDMLGNVWEWVADFRGTYPSQPEVDPVGPVSGTERICRGHTCFDGTYNNARSSSRDWGASSLSHAWTGFRLARDP